MKNKEIEELLNDINSYLSKRPFTQDITNVITLNEFKKLLTYIEQVEQCYCNRTDCSSRIKDSKKYDRLLQKYEQLENNRDKAIEFINSEEFNTLTINKRKKLNDLLKGGSDE